MLVGGSSVKSAFQIVPTVHGLLADERTGTIRGQFAAFAIKLLEPDRSSRSLRPHSAPQPNQLLTIGAFERAGVIRPTGTLGGTRTAVDRRG